MTEDPKINQNPAEEAKSDEKDTSKYQHFAISPYAKKLFEDEKGVQYALQFLGQMAGKANKEAWEQVYKDHPELKDAYAVFDEAKGDIYVVPKEELDRNMAEMLGMEIKKDETDA